MPLPRQATTLSVGCLLGLGSSKETCDALCPSVRHVVCINSTVVGLREASIPLADPLFGIVYVVEHVRYFLGWSERVMAAVRRMGRVVCIISRLMLSAVVWPPLFVSIVLLLNVYSMWHPE